MNDKPATATGVAMPGELYYSIAELLNVSGSTYPEIVSVLSHLLLNTMVAEREQSGVLLDEKALPLTIVDARSACERFRLRLSNETNEVAYEALNTMLAQQHNSNRNLN